MITLGIDPGQTGGLAFIYTDPSAPPRIVEAVRMPIATVYGKKIVDAPAVAQFLRGKNADRVAVEKVGAMPKQGVTSTFQFGRSTGAIEALVWGHYGVIQWIEPAKWKAAAGLIKAPKDASLSACERAFGWAPSLNVEIGIAEAALIGLYAARLDGN